MRKGSKHTQETIEKMHLIHKGIRHNPKGEFKTGDTSYWKGKKLPPEMKLKLSRIKKELFANGYIHPFKGKHHSIESRKKMSLIKKRNLRGKDYYREMGLKGLSIQQNSKKPTSIEKTLYDYLLIKGFLFERQKLINGRFLVDAYVPSLNLVIEADGNYWHSLDRVVKKDKAENAYLTKCGFGLLRLSENEIKSGKFKERLVS